MKRILLVFMVVSTATMVSATRPKYSSNGNVKPTGNLKPLTTFTLSLNNQTDAKFDFVLKNTVTLDTTHRVVNGSSIDYVYIPAGTYDIQVTPESIPPNVVYFSVQAGCSQFIEVFDPSITLHNITLNSSCSKVGQRLNIINK